ncbi:Retroelement pol polyprotein-like [Rhynchospora pubera]|uniref:Retroelement pol polyprotein-like n=1 Tax=Rhynchospora pubera TaxID=906938 RepID=A0AAV8G2Q8_9POAL|nr:Retroelement pol polyprotein-like [Rhynchospora pubera]
MANPTDDTNTGTKVVIKQLLDHSSSFYMYPSDNPGMLISSCILKGDNYDLWVKAMRNALRAKNKLGFIDGTITKPADNTPEAAVWDSCNSMLVSWLFNSIDSSLQPSIAYHETVKELWDDLQERLSVGNVPRIHQLKADIAAATQHGQPIVTYYTRIKTMWDELASYLPIPSCTCGGCTCNLTAKLSKEKEEEKIHQFLMGLDDIYDALRTNILSMNPMPGLNRVYSMVVQEERHKSVARGREERGEAVGFAVHVAKSDFNSTKSGLAEKPTCSHCGKIGHEVSQCFELIGYPEGWGRGRRGGRGGRGTGRGRGRGRAQANAMQGGSGITPVESVPMSPTIIPGLSDAQVQQIRAILGGSSSAIVSSSNEKLQGKNVEVAWILDSGASHHMTGNIECLTNVCKVAPSIVGLPNGAHTVAEHEGSDYNTRMLIGVGEHKNGVYYYHSAASGKVHHVSRTESHALSRRCVFLGYPFGKKGWRAMDLETNEFVVSRDVVFVETEFPFEKQNKVIAVSTVELEQKNNKEVNNFESDWVLENHGVSHNDYSMVERGSEFAETTEGNENHSIGAQIGAQEEYVDETTSEDVSDVTNMTQAPRVSSGRLRQPPVKLRDYICYTAQVDPAYAHSLPVSSSGTPYPISHYVNCDKFSLEHRKFLNAVTKEKEPAHFGEAIKNSNWRSAMKVEIDALERNNTWSVVELPQGKTAIGCKWVYRIKYHSNGTVERYKARLVALGNRQVEGIDYTETFSPVAKMATIRTVLAVAVAKRWELHQMDVHNAFLHGDLHEEVYMRLPPGFASNNPGKVCRLQKSLYGLRQAPRMWFSKLTEALCEYGFSQSRADYSLFVQNKGTVTLTVLVYVDDLIIAGNDKATIDQFKDYLGVKFHMKDLGPLKYFLGIEIARSSTGLFLSQRKYTLDILAECGVLGAKPAITPLEQNHNLSKATGVLFKDSEKYRRLIGRLVYLTITRPELSYAVHILAQFMQAPLQVHYDAALRVVRYLKGNPGQGILLRTDSDLRLVGYCDSDWASCPITRRSLTGYFVMLGGSPISWKTKKQPTVSRSSAEAEYRSMATVTCELIWLKSLLSFLGVVQVQPMQLFCDSQAALHIAANPVFHERTKHIEVDCHFVRDHIREGNIYTGHVSSTEQLADIFTKALGKQQFDYLSSKLGICDLHAPT